MAVRRTTASKAAPRVAHANEGYWHLSTRPLHALCVVTPLIIVYEILSLRHLVNQEAMTRQLIKAESLLSRFVELFGVAGALAPGLAIITILLVWHLVNKDRWRVQPPVLGGMVIESALWAIPLLVLGALLQRAMAVTEALPLVAPNAFAGESLGARVAISLGAGLYEELLFRLVAIALLHFLARDLLKLGQYTAAAFAIILSALAFSLYHDVWSGGSGPGGFRLGDAIFYFAAGVYFAWIYLQRGFGIVVLAHAIYDLIVLIPLSR
ncbi:MAG: lysostaphin resistance A-like protein [bacterium]|jgi:hypothetical protein